MPGLEGAGTVAAMGEAVTRLELGQTVGLGWMSRSCGQCESCLGGDQHLCQNHPELTIVGRYGVFAYRGRADVGWVLTLPDALPMEKAGPLFCGGITVFGPIVAMGVMPTDKVGVIGLGAWAIWR